MIDLFDASAMYDGDYLYFFAADDSSSAVLGEHTSNTADTRSEADADLIVRLLGLDSGASVLDVGCGHGRIARRLAARGALVTGVDVSTPFLERARSDAASTGVEVTFCLGDMRDLTAYAGRFDAVISWATAYGYFDDATNRAVLGQMRGALVNGGRLVMDLNNIASRLRDFRPSRVAAQRGPHDLLVDRYHLDPVTSRLEVTRTVVREGRARELTFVVRLFTFTELRDWLQAAGFTGVQVCGEDGEALAVRHERMVVTAVAD
ncbi:MAG TPA: class I SAM-dependent methyltransferase [Kineosporiaceae bacterium]|nr:class I SAM-dependent methyltransferase [Kineosporiaceae bacterium]